MASRRQIRANRRNARKSTGPKTEAGKAASSANALKHGLTAAEAVVLPEEEPEDFERLREGVIADLAPAGALQVALAQRIAVLLWRLDRVARLEAELFVHGHLARQRDSLAQAENQALVSHSIARHLGEEAMEVRKKLDQRVRDINMRILTDAPSAGVLVGRKESARAYDQLGRHEASLQRALNRTLDEFRRLRDASGANAEANAAPAAAPSDSEPPAVTADPDPGPEPAQDDREPPSGARMTSATNSCASNSGASSLGPSRTAEKSFFGKTKPIRRNSLKRRLGVSS